ncbi:MAG TPA: Crp/Fnr family transcriptional regulator [Gammaproteobacteria bacterium]|nr:Crp/Fnr family transcriptional regulator [Gammaproteobacteria bacterium]
MHDAPQPGLGPVGPASPRLLATLRGLASVIALESGDDLFQQGDAADTLYVLDEGTLEISVISDDGRRLAVNVLRSGTIFGEVALFDGGRRSATVTALEACRVLRIHRRAVISEVRSNPEFALDMLRLCIRRFLWVNALLEDQVFQPLGVRLARRVAFLLESSGEGNIVPMSQRELADHVGATREAVTKTLADWKKAGIVEIGRGRITIVDVDALQERAATGTV